MDEFNILIAGVGGQGQVLASRLIGAAAMAAGLEVRAAETIGMAQRGGSVISNVRIGKRHLSPAVPDGQGDLIIGFELCETARNLEKLRPGGNVLLNDLSIMPVPAALGLEKYDAPAMRTAIRKRAGRMLVLDGMKLAEQAGSVRSCNVVLLGAAAGAGFLPIPKDLFLSAVTRSVPKKYRELNSQAFQLGYHAGRSYASK